MISGNQNILMKCSSAWYLCYHFISEDEQFSCKSIWFDILLKTHCSQKQPPEVFATLLKWHSNTGIFLWTANDCSCSIWFLSVVAYNGCNTKNKNLNLSYFGLPWKITLCEEHFDKSCLNKFVHLGRTLKKTKD